MQEEQSNNTNVLCSDCNEYVEWVINRECDVVCCQCGLVLSRDAIVGSVDNFCFKESTYQRIAYFNENLANLFLQGPGMPDDLLLLVVKEAKKEHIYGRIKKFTPYHFRIIFRRVEITCELQEKYRTEPRPQNKFKSNPLKNLSKYQDKWRWVLKQICPDWSEPPIPPQWVILAIKTYFISMHAAHENFKKNKSHYPSYSFLIIKFMQLIDWYKKTELVAIYSKYIPLGSMNSIQKYSKLWNEMALYMGWVKESEKDNTSRNFPLNTIVIQKKVVIKARENEPKAKPKFLHYLSYSLDNKEEVH